MKDIKTYLSIKLLITLQHTMINITLFFVEIPELIDILMDMYTFTGSCFSLTRNEVIILHPLRVWYVPIEISVSDTCFYE